MAILFHEYDAVEAEWRNGQDRTRHFDANGAEIVMASEQRVAVASSGRKR